ncbi:UNVERIFIED_CONTAM: hypothetical protein GTU68_057012 [Idotea baltica]|nr:hypothetical protein [Idotea baltica]
MARITVEDCLEYESNRFVLVKLASIRAKQLLDGKTPVTDTKGNRAVVSALREIAAGKVSFTKVDNTPKLTAPVSTPLVEPKTANATKILSEIHSYNPDANLEIIRKAHSFALSHHAGQTRASGEPYITHVMEVAFLAAKLRMDLASIVAALLHDTVEDTDVSVKDVEGLFGEDAAILVDGVTKLSKVEFSSRAEQQAENFRKMLLAMAKDIRVLLLKLCDRLHNMRTLQFLSEARRIRIASETLEIYAPLAHRLGLHWIKSELGDLSLRHLQPEVYQNLKKQISETKSERDLYIKEVVGLIQQELKENDISGEVAGRSKHFYSIYKKMKEQNLEFSEIYDLIAFRIIVSSTRDAYGAVGIIHAAWRPIPGRFKDYIAMPKANNYQSLHTTVIGPRGHRIEIQLRTPEMHDIAERGIAAHWHYKENTKKRKKATSLETSSVEFTWLQDMVESGKLLSNPHEFMSSVKEDLYSQEVFVYSPRGDLIALAQGSTPIDFAFAIHTEVGNHCRSARVNGKQVPLSHLLENGDSVEIVSIESQTPSKDWLSIVATTKAKQRIRSWLKSEERSRSVSVGRELLLKEFKRVKRSYSKAMKARALDDISKDFGVPDSELLLAEIGYGKLQARSVVQKLFPEEVVEETEESDSALQKIFQKVAKSTKGKASIKVHGLDDVVFRLAKCCQPLPGDEVIGYVTRGRGVAVHRKDCGQILTFDEQRRIDVSWDDSVSLARPVFFRAHCLDQVGMLAALTQAISSIGVNIINLQVTSQQNGKAICSFEVNIENSKQLDMVTRKMESVDGVLRVERRKKKEA